MKAATLDLPRRGFIAGLCAATAKSALTSADVVAARQPRIEATDPIQALAARQISARELWIHDHAHEALDPQTTR